MDFPIETITVPIEIQGAKQKKMFVFMSAYPMKDDQAQIFIQLGIRVRKSDKIVLIVDLNKELIERTTRRTALFAALVKAQRQLESALRKLSKCVLTTNRVFDVQRIAFDGNAVRYNCRGFEEVKIIL